MRYLHRQIEESDKLIARIVGELEQRRRLVAIPGIGPITATATIAAIGNGAAFKKGRGFAAWLGVVPGEHSTGGKQKLTGTSRRGNKYLRKLFVQGAHTGRGRSASIQARNSLLHKRPDTFRRDQLDADYGSIRLDTRLGCVCLGVHRYRRRVSGV